MQQVNIIIGRFQPVTSTGHIKIAEKIYKSRGLKSVLCVIDTTKTDEKHPFLTKMMWSALKALTKEYESVLDVVLVKSADIIKMAEACAVKGYTITTWGCGTDRYDAYLKMCRKYAPEVEVIEIHREDSDISASAVRKAIKENKKEFFDENTPKCFHKLWNNFREALEALE